MSIDVPNNLATALEQSSDDEIERALWNLVYEQGRDSDH